MQAAVDDSAGDGHFERETLRDSNGFGAVEGPDVVSQLKPLTREGHPRLVEVAVEGPRLSLSGSLQIVVGYWAVFDGQYKPTLLDCFNSGDAPLQCGSSNLSVPIANLKGNKIMPKPPQYGLIYKLGREPARVLGVSPDDGAVPRQGLRSYGGDAGRGALLVRGRAHGAMGERRAGDGRGRLQAGSMRTRSRTRSTRISGA